MEELAAVTVDKTWEAYINEGIRLLLSQKGMDHCLTEEHKRNTPARVVKAYKEYFWGVHENPASVLVTSFQEEEYDEMIVVSDIDFTSWCGHHLLPFIGKVHFAYLPDRRIVGLSKIARLVDVLAARPQVQENLSKQIVDVFQQIVAPKGCGVYVKALHTCMTVRGVKKSAAMTSTVALRGNFKDQSVKGEFLKLVNGGCR